MVCCLARFSTRFTQTIWDVSSGSKCCEQRKLTSNLGVSFKENMPKKLQTCCSNSSKELVLGIQLFLISSGMGARVYKRLLRAILYLALFFVYLLNASDIWLLSLSKILVMSQRLGKVLGLFLE